MRVTVTVTVRVRVRVKVKVRVRVRVREGCGRRLVDARDEVSERLVGDRAAANRRAERHLDIGLRGQLLLVRVQAHLQACSGFGRGVRGTGRGQDRG